MHFLMGWISKKMKSAKEVDDGAELSLNQGVEPRFG